MKKLVENMKQGCKKLRTQLFFAYFATFLLFFAVVFGVMVYVVQNIIVTQIGTSRLDVLKQISERANTIKTTSITISNLYRYDKTLAHLAAKTTPEGRAQASDYLRQVKSNYDAVFKDVGISYDVVMIADDFTYTSQPGFFDFDRLQYQLWYRRMLQDLSASDQNEVHFVRTFYNDFSSPAQGYAFGAAGTPDGGGVILLLIDEMRLNDLYASSLSEGSSIYIFDKNGYIVSHPDKNMLGKQFIDVEAMVQLYGKDQSAVIQKLGSSYFLSTSYDLQTGWTIVEEIPCEILFETLYSAYKILGCTLGACLILGLLVSFYMSRHVSRPLAQLSGAMERFACTDFERLTTDTGTQEIDQLRENFNQMAGEIIALVDDIRARSKQKRLLELSFLRAQINPHFLYNTLFSIRCLVEINKNEQAASMLTAYTDLLKMTLSVENSVITLREEFEAIHKYLVLQKIRYGEDIGFELDLAPETAACYVPPLILQPVVENAIFHGIEAKKMAGTIVVCSALDNDTLIITVSDDGLGMSAEKLAAVRADMLQPPRQKQRSIGLANVHSRIVLNHGEGYGVALHSEQHSGTTVTLTLAAQLVPPSTEVIEQ